MTETRPRRLPPIIGLAGYSRAGKDTVGKILADRWCYSPVAFADALRAVVTRLNPLLAPTTDEGRDVFGADRTRRLRPILRTHGYEWAKDHTDLVDYLVALGAGVRELVAPNAWIDALERNMTADPRRAYVITDVRYRNEAAMIRRRGGIVLRIDRPGTGPRNDEEARNLPQIRPDFTITNDGTLDDLAEQVHALVALHREATAYLAPPSL